MLKMGTGLILNDLVYDWRRSLLSLVKLSVMVCTYLLAAILGRSFRAFSEGLVNSPQNLMIVSTGITGPMESSLPVELPEQAVQWVWEQFGSQAAIGSTTVLYRNLRVSNRVLQVLAVPPESFEPVFRLELLEGRWPTDLGEAAASRGAAQSLGWRIGEPFEIYGKPFQMVGIIETSSRGAASLWLPFAAGAQAMGLERGIQLGVIQVNSQADLALIQTQLEDSPVLAGCCSVLLERQMNENLNGLLRGFNTIGIIFQALALSTLGFGAFNVASLALLERHKELNTLRILGFKERAIRIFICFRTVTLAVPAFGLGWAAACFLKLPMRIGIIIYGTYVEFSLSVELVLVGIFLVVLSTLAGAWVAGASVNRALQEAL